MLVRLSAVSSVPREFFDSEPQSSVSAAVPAGTPVGCRSCRSAMYVSVVDVLVSATVVLLVDVLLLLLLPHPTVANGQRARAVVSRIGARFIDWTSKDDGRAEFTGWGFRRAR